MLTGLLLPAWAQPLAAPAEQTSSQRGLLWKIEGTASAPSYLFGTVHSDDPRVTSLPPSVTAVFNRSGSFTLEAIANGEGLIKMAEAMYFADTRTLEGILGQPLYQQTVRVLQSRGLPTHDIEKKKPWAILMALSMPKSRGGLPLDFALQLEATKQGKPTHGLETIAEQMGVFDGLPLSDQVSLLAHAIANASALDDQVDELLNTYLTRDLDALVALEVKHRPADDTAYRVFMDRLLHQRNLRMLERMAPRLKEGNAFIAVGALHLPGEEGLLRLLRRAGYRVTPIY
jgi:hypothetical protein